MEKKLNDFMDELSDKEKQFQNVIGFQSQLIEFTKWVIENHPAVYNEYATKQVKEECNCFDCTQQRKDKPNQEMEIKDNAFGI